jgi:NADH-quinone oxidoreductase subunit E
MGHYIIELIVWTLIAYLIGCLVGWLLRAMVGAEAPAPRLEPVAPEAPPAPPAPPKAAEPPPPVEVPPPAAPPAPEPVALAAAAPARMERPKGIAAARGGKPDDLQQISGIGPKNEKVLHNLGFFHFDQLAAWTEKEIAWVDDHLKFNGRIGREQWVHQAGLLAAGKLDEFRKLYGTGGQKTAQGQSESGSRTRK